MKGTRAIWIQQLEGDLDQLRNKNNNNNSNNNNQNVCNLKI